VDLASRIFIYDPKSRLQGITEQNRSSTQVRNLRAEGKSILGLVHPKVASYIDQHHLYAPDLAEVTDICNGTFSGNPL
jgi:hypothetical protein